MNTRKNRKLPVYPDIEWSEPSRFYGISRDAYTLLSEDNKQCCDFTSCRDWVSNVVYDMVAGCRRLEENRVANYNHGKSPMMCLTKLKLCMLMPRYKHLSESGRCKDMRFLGSWICKILGQLEKDLGISQKTKVFTVKESNFKSLCDKMRQNRLNQFAFVIEASPDWFISLPMLSLYTLMIRFCINTSSFKNKNGIERDYKSLIVDTINGSHAGLGYFDHSYINCIGNGSLNDGLFIKAIDEIKKVGYKDVFYKYRKKNYPKRLSWEDVHYKMGIISFSGGDAIRMMPHWYKKLSLK